MNLSELIPNNSPNWSFDNKFIYWKKYQKIPLCFIEDSGVVLFLDNRLPKPVLKLVEFLVEKNIKFYFLPPQMSNPSGIFEDEFEELVIRHYLKSYATKEFFFGFQKIDFDLIKNMTDWITKMGCFDKLKPIFDEVQKEVLRKHFDWYSKKDYYDFNSLIREEFQSLYRQIQISQII